MIKMIKKYRRPVLLVTDAIFIILAVIIFVRVRNAYDTLYHVQESKRWSTKDMPSAQIDVYVSENKAISINDINSVRAKIVKDLTTDGLIEEGNKKRIWADSFSAETEVEIKKDGNMYSANAVLTGGDFFLFHPIPVISGSYISESDEDPYRIVLDETMAWNIFGSTDVEGMEVFIGNRIYTVAGVVKVDKENLPKLLTVAREEFSYSIGLIHQVKDLEPLKLLMVQAQIVEIRVLQKLHQVHRILL